jgi:hypothetical protein
MAAAETLRPEVTEDDGRRLAIAKAFGNFQAFCGLLRIRRKGTGTEEDRRWPMVLTSLQREYCRTRTSRDIILKPRQVYMTTLEAARDLWWFITKPGARVVVVVQSQTDQAAQKDISEKFRIFIDSLRRLGVQFEFGRESATEWTLPKRDATLRIIQAGASEASASKKGRGGTINRLHISEAAFFERAEDTFNSLMESVPKTGSEVVIESTPNGADGFYYANWTSAVEGRSAYTPHFFSWWQHPEYRIDLEDGETVRPQNDLETSLVAKGVPSECLKWYRWKIREKGGNAQLVAQEFPSDPVACFIVSGRAFFDQARTDALLTSAVAPPITQIIRESGVTGQIVENREVPALRVWYEPVQGKSYIVAVDASEGTGGDAGAAIVFERGTGRHMGTLWGQFRPRVLAMWSKRVAQRFNNAQIVVERNEHGGTVLAALESEHAYGNVYRDPDDKPGFRTTAQSRPVILDTLEQAHRGHVDPRSGEQVYAFHTNDRFLLSEMRTFVVNKNGKPEAASGAHDDLVMAAAIGWHVVCLPAQRRGDWTAQLPPA